MRRFFSKYGFTLGIAITLVIVGIVFIYTMSFNALIEKHQGQLIKAFSSELQTQTGLQLDIKRIKPDFPFLVSFYDVTIDDEKSSRILSAKEVMIRADWLRIVKNPNDALLAIRYVEFIDPVIKGTLKEGKLDWLELITKKAPEKEIPIRIEDIKLKFVVSNGKIELNYIDLKENRADTVIPVALPFKFHGQIILVDGRVAIHPKLRFMWSNNNQSGPNGEKNIFPSNQQFFEISGYGRFDDEIKLWGKIDFKGIENYFPLIKKLIKPLKNEDLNIIPQSAEGMFGISISDPMSKDPQITADFELNVKDTKIESSRIPNVETSINSGVLRYSFPQNYLAFSCDGFVDKSPFNVNLFFEKILKGDLKGNVNLKDFPLVFLPIDRLPVNLAVEGNVDLRLELGTNSAVGRFVQGTVSSDTIKINNEFFGLEESHFVYRNGEFSFPEIILDGNSGKTITLNVKVNPQEKELLTNIQSRGLPFSFYSKLVKVNFPFPIDGSPLVNASISSKPDDFNANVEVLFDKATIANVPCADIHSILQMHNREVNIQEVVFTPCASGRFKSSGKITLPDKIDMSFNIAEVKLASLTGDATNTDSIVKGVVFGKGNIRGSFSKPELDASLKIYDAKIYDSPFENVQLDFNIDETGLKLGKAVLTTTGSSIELNAEYVFDNPRPMVLWGQWQNLPIELFTSGSNGNSVLLSGDGEFIGDGDDLNGIIRILIDGKDSLGNNISTPSDQPFTGTFLDIDLSAISRFESFNDIVKVFSKETVDEIKEKYIQKGNLEVTGGLRFESLVKESELNRFLAALREDILPLIPNAEIKIPEDKTGAGFTLPLDGLLAVNFSMEKAQSSWLINGFAEGSDFKIQNDPIKTLNARINTLETGNYNFGMTFSQGEGELTIRGQVQWEEVIGSSPMELNLSINSYPIKSLAYLAGLEAESAFGGLISGSGKVSGTPRFLRLENIDLSLQDAHIFGIPINDNRIQFSLNGSRMTIDKFELSGEDDLHAFASGFIELNPSKMSESQIDLRVDNLSLAKLRIAKIIPEGLGGTLSLITQLGYDQISHQPKIYIDLDFTRPSFKGVEIEKIIGQGIINGGTGEMKVGKMDCLVGNNSFSINGSIFLSSRQSPGKIDLKLAANDFDFVPLLQKMRIPLERDSAISNMDISINGTFSKPEVNGNLEMFVSKPRLENILFGDEIRAQIDIKNNIIRIEKDDFRITRNGSTIYASGNIDFNRFLNHSGDNLLSNIPKETFSINLINEDNIPYPIESFGMFARVLLKGKNSHPGLEVSFDRGKVQLSGIVQIVEGRYNVSTIPQPTGTRGVSPVEFDMTVLFPKGFPIRSGSTININLEESRFDIAGMPSYPSADGTLTVQSGQLRLLDRTFNIEEAVLQFKPFLGIDNPYLKGRATTVIVSQSIRNLAGTENIRVTAQIDARLKQLTSGIKFTSNRGTMTEDDLMAIIMRQDLFQDFQDEGLLTTLSQQAFTIPGAFISRFFETRGGFQNFQIGVDFEKDIFLNFEYEAFKDWFFDFYYLFASDTDLDIGVKYMFRRDSFIGVATDEDGSIILKFDYVIPLK